jgi:histidyl-tRNA synthetase
MLRPILARCEHPYRCHSERSEESAFPLLMAIKPQFQAIRGTRDLLPPETALWSHVERTAHEVFATYGYGEIRLPLFEPNKLFGRAVGDETDIVSKEMYKLELPLLEMRSYIEGIETGIRHLRQGSDTLARDEEALFVVLYFKFCEQALKEFEKSGIPRTTKNAELLDEFQRRYDSIHTQVYVEDPSDLRDLRKYLRDLIFDLDLGDELSLRPEATASVCRAYIEHNMQQLPQPVKLYYMGPMFRRERPQKGRYRQFYQIGAEVLGGSGAPAIDAELIEMLMSYFNKLNLQGTTLYINSIGHSADNCRRAYVAKLKSELQKVKDKLGPDSQRRIDTNPLRVLDSKLEFEQSVVERLPHISDHLCPDCAANYAAVKHELELRGVIYRENWRLVRGLDYYMRTTFEITAQGLGSQNAVCGGGRYDGLVELLGGPPTKGIGFAIGEDRLMLSLQEGGKVPANRGLDVYIAWMGQHAYAAAICAAKDIRNAGFRVELPPSEQKFGKALGQADKLGARYALILGDNEVAEGLWTLKTLADGTQTKLPEPALIEHLRNSIS